jgi:DNA-binding transcriptional MocR family regulator
LLYEQVAGEIESQIQNQTLSPGDRLPSVRQMSRAQKVSISTVVQAYIHLEQKGLVEARPQSGFYVKPQGFQLPEPDTKKPHFKSTSVSIGDVISSIFGAAREKDIIHLGAACLSPELYPSKKLNRLTSQVLKETPLHSAQYDMPPGYLPFRKQLAKRMLHSGAKVRAEDIVTTAGAMEAITLALKVCTRPGDTVMIESPIYYGTLQVLQSLGLKAFEVPCHPRTGVDPDEVRALLKKEKVKAGLFIPNFNNPVGSLMPDENKKSLVQIFSEKEIPLIEDDIYGDLTFSSQRPSTLKRYDNDDWVITCSSFSKTLAPGYRVGWVISKRFQEQLEREKFISTVATASLPQYILNQYLADGGYDRHIRHLKDVFSQQIHRVSDTICQNFPKETKFTRPLGGFVLWVELPKHIDSVKFHDQALQKGVSVTPGVVFSARGSYKNFIRLNCGNLWSPEIERALKKLAQMAHGME